MKIKPVEGRVVRDPRTMQILPEEGRDVPDTSFWHRRIRDGDVTVEDAPAETPHHRSVPRRET